MRKQLFFFLLVAGKTVCPRCPGGIGKNLSNQKMASKNGPKNW